MMTDEEWKARAFALIESSLRGFVETAFLHVVNVKHNQTAASELVVDIGGIVVSATKELEILFGKEMAKEFFHRQARVFAALSQEHDLSPELLKEIVFGKMSPSN